MDELTNTGSVCKDMSNEELDSLIIKLETSLGMNTINIKEL